MSCSFASLAVLLATLGQAPDDLPASDAVRQEQMEYLKERATQLALYRPDAEAPLPLTPQPVLRYSNNERVNAGSSSDGATFLWLHGTLPVAAVSLSIRRPNNPVYRECTSFSSTPLECRRDDASVWAPKSGGLLAQRFEGAPRPAASKVRRLAQMRDIARRFSVTHHSRNEETTQLRLLPTPLYRFAAEEHGVLDGALFAFVVSNDPEMLLLIEAAGDGAAGNAVDGAVWRYSLARMSSGKQVVRLDDREIWSLPNYHLGSPEEKKTGHYSEARLGVFRPSAP